MAETHRSAPSFQLVIGTETYKQPDRKGMEALVIEDHVDMVDLLTVRFGGGEGQPSWEFEIGDEVEAKLGSGENVLFRGQVTALEPSFTTEGRTTITLRALDYAHLLGRGRYTRFWEETKDSDIVQEVADECGIDVECDSTDSTPPYVLQRNETNVAFLKRLAARNNFLLRVEDGVLKFKKSEYSGDEVDLALGGGLQSLKVSFNSLEQVDEVIVRGWDITAKEEVVGTATTSDITQIGGGDLGADVSSTNFGASTAYVTDVPVSSQDQADGIALAEIERSARRFARGTGVCIGNDSIRAGTLINLSGLGSPIDGAYYILATRHIVSTQTGYTTEFTFCSNSFGS